MSPPTEATALALAASLVVTWLSIPLACALGFLDKPSVLKIHSRRTPRLGGLGIFAGFLAGTLVLGGYDRWVLLGASLMFIVGLVDDRLTISPWQKLVGQGVAAAALAVSVLSHDFSAISWAVAILAFLLVLVLANAVNLIDGMDGLAGGNAFLIFAALAALEFVHGMPAAGLLVVSAAVLGFLCFNFPRAVIFMGDSGSLVLGFLLASALVQLLLAGVVYFVCGILIAIVPFFDLTLGIVRRMRAGKHIFSADRGHFYDRINLAIGNPAKTVLLTYAFTVVSSALGLVASFGGVPIALATLVVVCLGLVMLSLSLGWFKTAPS